MAVLGWLLLASYLPTEAETSLLDVDFSTSSHEVHLKGKGSFDGVLPTDCRPNFTDWNNSIATSQILAEKETSFLRIHVDKVDEAVQFLWPLPQQPSANYYRLSVIFRSDSGQLPVKLRELPAPYEEVWSGQAEGDVRNAWCEKTFIFRLEKNPGFPVGLFFFPSLGNSDLRSLKLVRLTADEFDATMQRPAKGTANFFRNSRLPLGLQAGWSLGREFEQGSAQADVTERGPSGYFPLKLQSDKTIELDSEPFQTSDPLQKNSFSLACKGQGAWKWMILDERGRELASRTLNPSADWQTETVTLSLDESARSSRAFAFKIRGTGTISLDCFQAWAGTGDRPYTSQGECEVALALPDSDLSETRIQFSDAAPQIKYLATGALTGSTLRLETFDVFGQSHPLPDIPLVGQAGVAGEQAGLVDFAAAPNATLGQFRIEAWIERQGKRISPLNEFLVTRIHRPRHWTEDAPSSPFGSHFLASPLMIKTMKAAGVNWVRLHDAGTEYIGWYHLESQKGTWTFHDEELNRYRDSHIKIYAGLQTSPTWASNFTAGSPGLDSYHERYFQPKDLKDWSNYVRTVTARYKSVIDDYFIWNEPWGDQFWFTGFDSATKTYLRGPHAGADYAQLSIAAYRAAKEGNPAAQIAGFNTTGGSVGSQWTRDVFAGGAYDACDLVDYHFYTTQDQAMPGDGALRNLTEATNPISSQVPSFSKRVYMSEGQANSNGSSGGVGTGLYHRALPWDASSEKPLLEADKTCRFVVANLAAGAAKVFLYTAHGYQGLFRPGSYDTLVGPDGYPHVELAAFSNLAWHLEDKKFITSQPLGHGACAYLFEGKDGSTAVISGTRDGSYRLPVLPDIEVSDLFGNPLPLPADFKGVIFFVDSSLPAATLAHALTGN